MWNTVRNVRFTSPFNTSSTSISDTRSSNNNEYIESNEIINESPIISRESSIISENSSNEEDRKLSLKLYHNISEMRNYLSELPEPEVFTGFNIPSVSDTNNSSRNSSVNSNKDGKLDRLKSKILFTQQQQQKPVIPKNAFFDRVSTGKKLSLSDIVKETKKNQSDNKQSRMQQIDLEEELKRVNSMIKAERYLTENKEVSTVDLSQSFNAGTQTYSPLPETSLTATKEKAIETTEDNDEDDFSRLKSEDIVGRVQSLLSQMVQMSDHDEPDPVPNAVVPYATQNTTSPTSFLSDYEYIQPSSSLECLSNRPISLSEAKHKIFTMFDEISSQSSLKSRDRILFPERKSEQDEDLELMRSIPIKSWSQCMQDVTKLRLKRLREIKDILEEEREIIFTRSKISDLYKRVPTLRLKILTEKKKSILVQKQQQLKLNKIAQQNSTKKFNRFADRSIPAAKPNNQNNSSINTTTTNSYQSTILDCHLSNVYAKIFLILLRNAVHIRKVAQDLITRMNDEVNEYIARSTLYILLYNSTRRTVLTRLEQNYTMKNNRLKRRTWFFKWKQVTMNKQENNYNIQKADGYLNRKLLRKAFNTFVLGCLLSRQEFVGTTIATVWSNLKLLSKCYYGWKRVSDQELYLKRGLCSLAFTDMDEDEMDGRFKMDKEVESYWQFRCKILIRNKIQNSNNWLEEYKKLQELIEHRKGFSLLDLSDVDKPTFATEISYERYSISNSQLQQYESDDDINQSTSIVDRRLDRSIIDQNNKSSRDIAENQFYSRISNKSLEMVAAEAYRLRCIRNVFKQWFGKWRIKQLDGLAHQFYTDKLLRKSFYSLASYKRKDVNLSNLSVMVETNINIRMKHRYFQTWKQWYQSNTVKNIALSEQFRYESLVSRALIGLKFYSDFRKQQQVDEQKVNNHYNLALMRRAMKAWLMYMVNKRVKMQVNSIADDHRETVLKRKTLTALKLFGRRQSLISKIIDQATERRIQTETIENGQLLGSVIRSWYKITQRASKRRQFLIMKYQAGVHNVNRIKKNAFEVWKGKSRILIRSRMSILQNIGIMRRFFIKWRDMTKRRRQLKQGQEKSQIEQELKKQNKHKRPKVPHTKIANTKELNNSIEQIDIIANLGKEDQASVQDTQIVDQDLNVTPPISESAKVLALYDDELHDLSTTELYDVDSPFKKKTRKALNRKDMAELKRILFYRWRDKYYEYSIVNHFKKKKAMNALKQYAFNYSQLAPLEFMMKRFFDRWKGSAIQRRRKESLDSMSITAHNVTLLSKAFRVLKLNAEYRRNYRKKMSQAKRHYRRIILRKAFRSLHAYAISRLKKKMIYSKANHHYHTKLTQASSGSSVISTERVFNTPIIEILDATSPATESEPVLVKVQNARKANLEFRLSGRVESIRRRSRSPVPETSKQLPPYFKGTLQIAKYKLAMKTIEAWKLFVLKKQLHRAQRARAIHMSNFFLARKVFRHWLSHSRMRGHSEFRVTDHSRSTSRGLHIKVPGRKSSTTIQKATNAPVVSLKTAVIHDKAAAERKSIGDNRNIIK
jgi:hypothetical protein